MTAKKKITEKGVLESTIRKFMTPQAMEDMKVLMENPTLQQFLLRWQEADHEILGDQLKEELQEFLAEIYEKDNQNLCKEVTASVCGQMEEFLTNINTRLAELSKGQEAIALDIGHIKDDILDIKKRLKTDEDMLVDMDKRIIRLEKYASKSWTIIRNVIAGLITGIISVGIGIIIFLEIHARLIN